MERAAGVAGGLIEREVELAALGRAAALVADRHVGQLLTVVGPAGVGKSTVLDAAAGIAGAAGLRVLKARSSELESDFPFGVVLQLFERVVSDASPTERKELFSGAARFALALLSEEGAGAEPPGEQAYTLIHGVFWLTGNLAWRAAAAGSGGLALLVDDLPWVDRGSLQVLNYLAQRLDDMPVLVVATARSGDPGASGDLTNQILDHPRRRLLAPRPLTVQAVGRLVRSALGNQADEAFCGACARVTGGNPFLVHALLAQLISEGVIPSAAAAEDVGRLAPTVVQHSVLGRLGRLPGEAQRFAQSASVLGEGCQPLLAGALAGIPAEDVMAAADALRGAEILRTCDPVVFAHPLVRSAIESDMAPGQRAMAHSRAATLLAGRGAAPEEVAVHLLHAPAGQDPSTIEVLRAAARRAIRRGLQETAARYLARAVEEGQEPELRGALLAELGQAETAIGDARGIAHLDRALTLITEPADRASVWRRLAEARMGAGQHEQAALALEEGLAELGNGDDPLSRELRATYVTVATLDASLRQRGLEQVPRVLELSRDRELPEERVVMAQLALQKALAAEPAHEIRELAERAWGDGALLENERPDGIAWTLITGALTIAGAYASSARVANAVAEEARRRGAPLALATAVYCRGWPELRSGRLADAVADCEQALAARSFGWAAYIGSASAVLALALVERAEADRAEEVLGLADDPGYVDSLERAPLLEARGRLRLAQGRAAAALVDFEESGRRFDAVQMRAGFSFWRTGAALASWLVGDIERAEAVSGEELEVARHTRAPALIGAALSVRGLVRGGNEGVALLHDAVETLAASEATLEHIAALVSLGGMLRRTGQRARAREPLHEAIGRAEAIGARRLARRAREELRAAGGRLRSGAGSGREVLTPGERRVAQLAAAGHTNREIAQDLFVTQKAVEWHLANAYGKLGIRSRRELADRLVQQSEGA